MNRKLGGTQGRSEQKREGKWDMEEECNKTHNVRMS